MRISSLRLRFYLAIFILCLLSHIAQIADLDATDMRLDKWLASWSQLSRVRLRGLIENGEVRADGVIIKRPTTKVRTGVEYAIHVPPPIDDTPQAENIPLDIIYEDEALIVVNKPAGMTVHPRHCASY